MITAVRKIRTEQVPGHENQGVCCTWIYKRVTITLTSPWHGAWEVCGRSILGQGRIYTVSEYVDFSSCWTLKPLIFISVSVYKKAKSFCSSYIVISSLVPQSFSEKKATILTLQHKECQELSQLCNKWFKNIHQMNSICPRRWGG